jgi:RNA polymerase sigma-70 factor (ECF subfamily)
MEALAMADFRMARPKAAAPSRAEPASVDESGARAIPTPSFEAVYDEHFDFVWRSVKRLGVRESAIDDAVQDVFLVVHRRLGDFEGRSSMKTWLFGIALRVAKDHRRALARKDAKGEPLRDSLPSDACACPLEETAKTEAARLVQHVLDAMDDEKRAVFVMAELEQMTAPEIAEALSVNLNTIYARLRAARAAFEDAVARYRARDGWRPR